MCYYNVHVLLTATSNHKVYYGHRVTSWLVWQTITDSVK